LDDLLVDCLALRPQQLQALLDGLNSGSDRRFHRIPLTAIGKSPYAVKVNCNRGSYKFLIEPDLTVLVITYARVMTVHDWPDVWWDFGRHTVNDEPVTPHRRLDSYLRLKPALTLQDACF
jgi:hypothetical protein